MRLYRLAQKFHLPLVTLVDTPGAYPGPEAEERGQAEAIATSIATMTGLQTPIVAIIIGEGGSGGALALAVGDVVLALQNAIYSVISPEGAAAILWRSATEAEKAANALKLAASDLLKLGIVDGLIPVPAGGGIRCERHRGRGRGHGRSDRACAIRRRRARDGCGACRRAERARAREGALRRRRDLQRVKGVERRRCGEEGDRARRRAVA